MLAETGDLIDNANGTFLVLQNGVVQRREANQRDPAMVVFDRYAFDLSQFAGGPSGGEILDPRALSLAVAVSRPEGSDVSASSRANSAPNCMTG